MYATYVIYVIYYRTLLRAEVDPDAWMCIVLALICFYDLYSVLLSLYLSPFRYTFIIINLINWIHIMLLTEMNRTSCIYCQKFIPLEKLNEIKMIIF